MTGKPGRSNNRIDAAGLRAAGRQPGTPFSMLSGDGSEFVVHHLLRVLPGKRIVGDGEWNGKRVLAKLFIADGSARHWAKETAGIEELRRAGIPTPELLLTGALPAGGHIVLTAYLEESQSLAEAWQPVCGRKAGDEAALEVLRPAFGLLGSIHAAGLVQDDLHLGNFLRCADQLFVIDGDAVRAISPGQPLDEKQAASNLAVLLAQLPTSWDGCREALLEAYRAGGGRLFSDALRLEGELLRARTWRLNDFLGKTVRDCSRFVVMQNAFSFRALRRDAADRLQPIVASPDKAMAQGSLIKNGRTCTVARVGVAGADLVIKRYNLKNLKHVLERFWRPSRAWRSWREGYRLQFHGIATPMPMALIEERVGPLRRRAFLINEFCPGIGLQKCLSPDAEPPGDVAQAICELFQTLHKLRISHGDLKASNLLWDTREGRVVVIDLDAMTQHRSETGYARAWRDDRARLLRNWPAGSALHQWLDRALPPAT